MSHICTPLHMDTCESAWHLPNAARPRPCHTANIVPPLCAACVTRGVRRHIVSSATPKPAPTGRLAPHTPMPCTCRLATRVRAAYFLSPANMCARENPPARLRLSPAFPGSLRSLPPTPLPGDSQRPKLINAPTLGSMNCFPHHGGRSSKAGLEFFSSSA